MIKVKCTEKKTYLPRGEQKNCQFCMEGYWGKCSTWNVTQKHGDTYQFAVVVFAIPAVLDVVCVRSLLLAQQPRKLGTAAEKHASGVKRSDEKAKHFKEKLP